MFPNPMSVVVSQMRRYTPKHRVSKDVLQKMSYILSFSFLETQGSLWSLVFTKFSGQDRSTPKAAGKSKT